MTLRQLLDQGRRQTPACSGPVPKDRGHLWVEPRFVAEVRYLTWTADGLMRQPVFLRMRHDEAVQGCVVPADRAREMGDPSTRRAT